MGCAIQVDVSQLGAILSNGFLALVVLLVLRAIGDKPGPAPGPIGASLVSNRKFGGGDNSATWAADDCHQNSSEKW